VGTVTTLSPAAARVAPDPVAEVLDGVFFALSDPGRRAMLERLDEGPLLVSELAAPFQISLQAVSRHIQVLVRAGLVRQERTGRISQCRLDAGPILAAAVWINRYSKYWQQQFETLAAALDEIDERRNRESRRASKPRTHNRISRPAAAGKPRSVRR
jgi:DNA-binding transcriptional ArsR family regulator